MSTEADLQALFAALSRPSPGSTSNASPSDNQQQQQRGRVPPQSMGYAPPYVSSPLFSPPPTSHQPHHGSDVISPNVSTPRHDQNSQATGANQSSQLLNLLKFSQASQQPTDMEPPSAAAHRMENSGESPESQTDGRISASDLVSSFFGGKPSAKTMSSGMAVRAPDGHSSADRSTAESGENAQDMLLRLLNRPKPQQMQSTESVRSGNVQVTTLPLRPSDVGIQKSVEVETEPEEPIQLSETPPMEEHASSPVRTFGSAEVRESTPFEPPQPSAPAKGTIFSYVNPFEQLAATSPRTRSPRNNPRSRQGSSAVDVSKTPGLESPLNSTPGELNQSDLAAAQEQVSDEGDKLAFVKQEHVSPTLFHKGKLESKGKETVPGALEEAAGKIDIEAGEALARASGKKVKSKHPEPDEEISQEIFKKITEQLFNHNKEIKNERSEEAFFKEPAQPLAETAKSVKEETTKENLADNWETEAETERIVSVYNFPLKPFVAIAWKGNNPAPVKIRDDGVMDIARLKKGFDQLDRSLTSATSEYIVYALAKNGGARIIRQDDGHDRQIFRSSNDRVFNVSVSQYPSSSPATKEQSFLGIGVSGSVYWAPISRGDEDLFGKDSLETESLIFPPFPTSDENTSGGQLKTRAKQSSRHPEMFAIGRGKSIHLVWPRSAMTSEYGVTSLQRKVDTEKYFKERSVKIATGKAGKDYVFSDDDTIIVSLDKTGRLRFWDIREIGDPMTSTTPKVDIRIPLLTLITGSPNEKSWPTSVLFIDKQRPYLKAQALRYILVGLKQNHTLQLWDIGLGKAVQELSFPHTNESDPICSVAYHPGSGFIVVGHPTRNSIYFIHLSSPRYSLPAMSQGTYMQRVADKDPDLPKPESTACMSGIRELSFGPKGQLRSLELLPLAKPSSQRGIDEEVGLFELYVMHSRGVTCLNIKKVDLGWSVDNKIIHSVDALEHGYIESKDLQSLPGEEQAVRGDGIQSTSKSTTNDITKKPEPVAGVPPRSDSPKKRPTDSGSTSSPPEQAPIDKSERKKKKKTANDTAPKAKDATKKLEETAEVQIMTPSKPSVAQKETKEVQLDQAGPQTLETESTSKQSTRVQEKLPQTASMGLPLDLLSKEVKKIEQTLTDEFSKTLNRELNGVYRRFDEDRRTQDAAATSRQDAVLRLISSTLSDNVEKNLARIISGDIQSTVIPALKDMTSSSLEKHVNGVVSQQLTKAVSQSIKASLPGAISQSMQAPDTLHAMSELMVPKIASRIEKEFSKTVRNTIAPALKEEYTRSTENITKEVEKRFVDRVKQLESQQLKDSAKIDELTALVRSMADSVSTIAAAQDGFGNEIRKLHRQAAATKEAAQAPPSVSQSSSEDHPTPPSAEDTELSEIAGLMSEGRYEQASVRWLQSAQQAYLFNHLFVHQGPAYLTSLSPILALSVSAAVTSSFESNVMERLRWLHQVFNTVNVTDKDIIEVAPRIMDILISRLDELYNSIAQNTPHDPVLRHIPPLVRWARDLKNI